MVRTISLKQLREAGACDSGIERFLQLTGGEEEVEVTLDACYTSVSEISWRWAGENLLSGVSYARFCLFAEEIRKKEGFAYRTMRKAFGNADRKSFPDDLYSELCRAVSSESCMELAGKFCTLYNHMSWLDRALNFIWRKSSFR